MIGLPVLFSATILFSFLSYRIGRLVGKASRTPEDLAWIARIREGHGSRS